LIVYSDDTGRRVVRELDCDRLTIGRRRSCDVALPWDDLTSRLHAELVQMGSDWVICDDGLSHNGTFVNDRRVRGRRRLRDGDVITAGATQLMFIAPRTASTTAPTDVARQQAEVALTPAQRRLLIALCRPLVAATYAAPASNKQIAAELGISVETVKGTLSALFELFGVADLPQNQKRAALAAQAVGLLQR
jgi:predicted component of type VI protein secretion system